MRCMRYIESLAWVILVGITGLLAFLYLAQSIQLFEHRYLGGGVFVRYRVVGLFLGVAPAASATILGCQAQRPLGVRRPFWVRMLLAAWALFFAFCLLVPLAGVLDVLWSDYQFTWCALIAISFFALALSMLHPAFWNSAFSATVVAAGLLLNLLLFTLGTASSLLSSLLYFPTVLGLYAASLVLRRA